VEPDPRTDASSNRLLHNVHHRVVQKVCCGEKRARSAALRPAGVTRPDVELRSARAPRAYFMLGFAGVARGAWQRLPRAPSSSQLSVGCRGSWRCPSNTLPRLL